MVRSNWNKALVFTFAWAGLALAQQPPTSPAPATRPELSTGQTFTVQEPGKVGQKCKVLKSWKTPDGKTAYQVKSLTTGEMMTIVETSTGSALPPSQGGNGPRVQAVATRIFHWGSNQTPPAGTPMPPIESVQYVPPAKPGPEITNSASMVHTHPTPVGTPAAWGSTTPSVTSISEPEKPGFFARVFPWANRSRESTKNNDTREYIVPGSVTTREVMAPPNNTSTKFPGLISPRVTDSRVQTSPMSVTQNNSTGSTASDKPSTSTGQPPASSGKPLASSNQPKPATPDNRLGSASTSQPKTSIADTWTTQPKSASQDKSNPNQTTTATPDRRLNATSSTQPNSSFQNPWIIAPKTAGQVKPSSTPDKTTSTPASGSTTTSPYFQTSPASTSRVTPPSAAAPQRVVQVIPPSSGTTAQTPSTTSAAPSASGSSTNLLNRQTVPAAPANKIMATPTAEKKPDATTTSNGPIIKPWSTQATTGNTATQPKMAPSTPSTAWTMPATPTSTAVAPPPPKTTATTPSPAWPTPTGLTTTSSSPSSVKPATTTPSTAWTMPTTPSSTTITSASPKTTATPASPAWPTTTPSSPSTVKPATTTPSTAWPTSAAQSQTANLYKPPVSTLIPYYPTSPITPSGSSVGTQPASTTVQPTTTTAPVTRTPGSTTTATPATQPAAVIPAPPSDWRQSWGTTKPAQSSTESYLPPAKPALPQADSNRPDPLQMPQQFYRPPTMEEKPISKKSDPALVPAAAVASSAPAKPPVTDVPIPAQAKPPVATVQTPVQARTSTTSMPVPLGAQSVVQAGDPGPGGVRYVPVPMVTIPDIKRAPVPLMTNPAQVYSTPSGMTAGANGNQMNAFTPAPVRPAFAQGSNAFGAGTPAVMSAPYGQTMQAPGSAGMMAQTMSPSSIYPAANSSVVPAGFQGTGLSNSVVSAGYHTATNMPLAPTTHLVALKPTPENIHQMEATLRDSLYPSQREWAAESMAAVDWRTHPQVVQALTTAAKEDPAPSVRASCVRCLAAMKVNTLPVVTVVQGLKNDKDPRVRQEAERAWPVLAGGEK